MKKNKETLETLKTFKSFLKSAHNNNVYARVVSVSQSGMSRHIHFVCITNKGRTFYPTYWISKILGYHYNDREDSITVSGCGMDMIFNTLYNINCVAINYGLVRRSKNKDAHELRYNGLVNTHYSNI